MKGVIPADMTKNRQAKFLVMTKAKFLSQRIELWSKLKELRPLLWSENIEAFLIEVMSGWFEALNSLSQLYACFLAKNILFSVERILVVDRITGSSFWMDFADLVV